MPKASFIEVMDTTLRDGEQTQSVAFSPQEKLGIAKMLLHELNVDRIEVANARISSGELKAVKNITSWAKNKNYLAKLKFLVLLISTFRQNGLGKPVQK